MDNKKLTAEDIAKSYIKNEINDLRKKHSDARSSSFEYEYSLRQLEHYLKNNPELFSETERSIVEYNVEGNVAISLDKFILEGDEVPFFSEAKLYDLLGKGAARSVLAFIERLATKAQK